MEKDSQNRQTKTFDRHAIVSLVLGLISLIPAILNTIYLILIRLLPPPSMLRYKLFVGEIGFMMASPLIFLIGLLFPIFGVLSGKQGLKSHSRRKLAKIGLVCSVISLVAFFVLPVFSQMPIKPVFSSKEIYLGVGRVSKFRACHFNTCINTLGFTQDEGGHYILTGSKVDELMEILETQGAIHNPVAGIKTLKVKVWGKFLERKYGSTIIEVTK